MQQHNPNPGKSLFDQDKDNKIKAFLQTVPFGIHTFSETGMENIAKVFSITIDQLKQRIAHYKAKEGQQDV